MKKLPKGLKTWPAYSEVKKQLDHFNECLPLLELLINPAMQVKKSTVFFSISKEASSFR